MVSFQCDCCQDVVKKPKLDSHGARCHASFTCIDCSKTFAGPAQWKGHISCMTEEQKYHKSVYQEPRGRGRGRGQRGMRGGRGGGRPSYSGSGENAVPLGSQMKAWNAPSPDPINNEPFNSNEWTANGDKTSTEAQPHETTSPTDDTPAQKPEKKSKKSKKRKAEEVEIAQAGDTTSTAEEPVKKKKKKQADEPVAESTADPLAQTGAKDKKKKKKSRKSEVGEDDAPATQNGGPHPNATIPDAEIAPTEKKAKDKKEKKEKKEKRSRKSEGTDEAVSSNAINGHSTAHSNGEAPATIPLATFVNNNSHPSTTVIEEFPSEISKSKEVTEPGASNGVDGGNRHGEPGEKKKKKEKKGKAKELNGTDKSPSAATSEVAAPKEPDTNDLIPISTIEAKAVKKEKKEKKEKKAKEKKAKDTTNALPVLAPTLEQSESSPVEKPKKRKAKDESTISDAQAMSNSTSESMEKPKKKKSKRRDKDIEATVA